MEQHKTVLCGEKQLRGRAALVVSQLICSLVIPDLESLVTTGPVSVFVMIVDAVLPVIAQRGLILMNNLNGEEDIRRLRDATTQ